MLTTYRKLWDLFDRRGRLGLLALLLVMLLAALVEALAIVAVVPFLSALKGDSAALPGAWARLAVGGDDGLPATGVALAFVVLVVLPSPSRRWPIMRRWRSRRRRVRAGRAACCACT